MCPRDRRQVNRLAILIVPLLSIPLIVPKAILDTNYDPTAHPPTQHLKLEAKQIKS